MSKLIDYYTLLLWVGANETTSDTSNGIEYYKSDITTIAPIYENETMSIYQLGLVLYLKDTVRLICMILKSAFKNTEFIFYASSVFFLSDFLSVARPGIVSVILSRTSEETFLPVSTADFTCLDASLTRPLLTSTIP